MYTYKQLIYTCCMYKVYCNKSNYFDSLFVTFYFTMLSIKSFNNMKYYFNKYNCIPKNDFLSLFYSCLFFGNIYVMFFQHIYMILYNVHYPFVILLLWWKYTFLFSKIGNSIMRISTWKIRLFYFTIF